MSMGESPATPEWIRAHAFDILAVLERMHDRDANVCLLPHRLHWRLWLLGELEPGKPLDG
jgi:hypothetical protein